MSFSRVTPNFLWNTLEKFGFVNMQRFEHPWQDRLQQVYVLCQSIIFLIHFTCHFFNTVTRATRYLPEFFQTFFEDCIMFFLLSIVCLVRTGNRIDQLNYVRDFVEKEFSQTDTEIISKCYRQSKLICLSFVGVTILAISGAFLESMLPLTEAELKIRTDIYRTAHPERRLPFPNRIPYVDETQSWSYEILYGIDIYIMFFFAVWVGLTVTYIPITIIHLRGQYEILAKYIRQIGHKHRNMEGDRIFYTNIENDEFYVKMYTPIRRGNIKNKFLKVAHKLREKQVYERNYMGQIVRFHLKLVAFQAKVLEIAVPVMYGMIFFNNIMISLCLYQLMVEPSQQSWLRIFKFTAELIAVSMEYFTNCYCSEMLDDCHGLILSALNESRWECCSNRTKRDLVMLLQRVQKPNYWRLCNGAIVINSAFFLKVIKVAYTFVNFMRLKGN